MKKRRIFLLIILTLCLIISLLIGLLALTGWLVMVKMPGVSYLDPSAQADYKRAQSLRQDVEQLATQIGERNTAHPLALKAATDYLQTQLKTAGYRVEVQTFQAGGQNCHNLEVFIPGQSLETLVLGAHYDSAEGSPGANDNASGSAVLLDLARRLAKTKPHLSLRLVWFVNEEQPYSMTEQMGSLVYARQLKQNRIPVIGMLSLETLGYYTDVPKSQFYPVPLNLYYPDTGNFIGFVTRLESRPLLDQVISGFRQHARIPSEGLASPELIQDIGRSDHWSFWMQDYPALMITDTAPFRYPHYHRQSDTAEQLDYNRLALLSEGLENMLKGLKAPPVK